MKPVNCILLIDDDENCNFFHKRLLERNGYTKNTCIAENGEEALFLLKDKDVPMPDIIFLDINMPVMDGWEFLEEYVLLDEEIKSKILLMILTSSLNPDDKKKAEEFAVVRGFETKYLNQEALDKIFNNL